MRSHTRTEEQCWWCVCVFVVITSYDVGSYGNKYCCIISSLSAPFYIFDKLEDITFAGHLTEELCSLHKLAIP
jgi:hypothetical protein